MAIRSLKINREDSGRNVEGARDSEDPTKERGTDELALIANAMQPGCSLADFVDNELGNLIVFKPSRIVTLHFVRKIFQRWHDQICVGLGRVPLKKSSLD